MYHDHEIDIILDETRENNPKQFLFFLCVIAFEGVAVRSVRCRGVADGVDYPKCVGLRCLPSEAFPNHPGVKSLDSLKPKTQRKLTLGYPSSSNNQINVRWTENVINLTKIRQYHCFGRIIDSFPR